MSGGPAEGLERPPESDEGRAREVGKRGEQFVLEAKVVNGGMRSAALLVMPVSAGAARVGVVTGVEPLLMTGSAPPSTRSRTAASRS
jgi:hypothetical protein